MTKGGMRGGAQLGLTGTEPRVHKAAAMAAWTLRTCQVTRGEVLNALSHIVSSRPP